MMFLFPSWDNVIVPWRLKDQQWERVFEPENCSKMVGKFDSFIPNLYWVIKPPTLENLRWEQADP